MSHIRIYDKALTFIGEISNYKKLVYRRGLYEAKQFSIEIDYTKESASLLAIDNFVIVDKDKHKIGIIEYVSREAKSRKGITTTKMVVRGREASSLFRRRSILPEVGNSHVTYTTTATETIIKDLIDVTMVTPTDTDRTIDIVNIIATSSLGPVITKKFRYQDLNEAILGLLRDGSLGVSVTYNEATDEIDVDLFEGLDRTKDQAINSIAIFDQKFGNVTNQKYVQNNFNYKNFGYAGGQGEGAAREIQETGTATGIDRREVFLDVRQESTAAGTLAAGEERLKTFSTNSRFENKVNNSSNLTYEIDYDLGDIITVANENWDVLENKRITGVIETYVYGNDIQIELEFGDKIPSSVDLIKAGFVNTESETTI